MRFSCIIAMVVLSVGLASTRQRTVLAQPYQKVWSGPSQRGVGIHQTRQGYPPSSACQPSCHPPCGFCQPKGGEPPGEPKGATRSEPRAAAPGIAPGVFVSPPQSGVVEGPSRGFEIGDISLTLPEIKLGFPRLRCVGIKHFSRDARMMTDRAAAPYVGNPYYAAAMSQARSASANREAEEPEDDGNPKSAQKKGGKDRSAKETCQPDLEMRIQRLENCFEMQVQALQSCVEELRALRSAGSAYQKSSTYVPAPPSDTTEARSDIQFRSPRPLPPTRQVGFGQEAARTNYEVVAPQIPAPQSVPLRRLPAATQ